LGTDKGVSEFDGTKWINYNYEENNFQISYVLAIAVDPKIGNG